MNKLSHMNKWNAETLKVHVEPTLIPLIKIKDDDKSDQYSVKIKLFRYRTSEKSYLYELKMAFFDNGEPDDFLLFI